jgi:hypothetical protein
MEGKFYSQKKASKNDTVTPCSKDQQHSSIHTLTVGMSLIFFHHGSGDCIQGPIQIIRHTKLTKLCAEASYQSVANNQMCKLRKL